MPNFRETQTLPYTVDQLYQLVIDIEQYPKFVTGCTQAKIISKNDGQLTAELGVGFGPLQEVYTSQVTFKQNEFIRAECHSKPFKHMVNEWHFENHPMGCKIDFSIDFEFQKSLFNIVANQVFLSLAKEIMYSFIKRAESIYG